MIEAQTPPRQINAQGLEHIKRWEGLRLRAYLCPGGAWTIGYGHTVAAGPPAVVKGMVIDEMRAEALLLQDLQHYEAAVVRLVRAPLSDNQFSALVSFAYNIGTAAFAKSRIPALINKGNYHAVPAELMRYVYAGGKRLEGLVNRRAAEAGLWAKGDFVSSSAQRAEPKREMRWLAPEVVAPLAGSAAGLAAFADGQGPFQWALALIMVLCALGGAWYFVRRMRRAMF
ncbi:MAG: lysozyme [Candidatus Tokpelaia sp.]|uniref:lysozyme n=1 Tax=Candidatus Tokpelaia sp. TaxID=2233777 RepID=UPI00123B7191|nr:lysozyme [Candidatus Tokpelaia sp.]KAA6204553.1 MAG: lysozyme [Candidatus Tokpelaia sp.]KAA6206860.1 MAG: lysozyme [Candidatus Tokpelaia sp.]KAA6404620.1 lysozyme [Candidatus Tokpelaia sp.]